MLKVGDEVEAKFMAVDRKVRTIALSIKAKEAHEEAEAVQNYRSDSTTGTSLGDLLKEQISGQDSSDQMAGPRRQGAAAGRDRRIMKPRGGSAWTASAA